MYEIFAKLLEQKGVTPYQVYKATGVAQSSLSDWKNGKSKPKYEKMVKIADYFGVTVDYLLGKPDQKEKAPAETEASDPLSQVSFALFGKHEELDDEILDELREYARFKLEQKKHKEKK